MSNFLIENFSFRKVLQDVKEKSIFIGATSFESRCTEAVKLIRNYSSVNNFDFYIANIEDDKNYYRDQCSDLQNKNRLVIKNLLDKTRKTFIDGMLSKSDEVVGKIQNLIAGKESDIFFDISTVPTKIFFPIVKFLFKNINYDHKIYIIYTSVINYPHWLSKDPEEVSYISGFVGSYSGGKKHIWIPILGFEGGLAKKVYENGSYVDICPVIGFPSIMIDRVLYANKDIIDKLQNGINDIRYSPLYDPFEMYKTLKSIITGYGQEDAHFTISPFGTKPQSLGCCVLAIEEDLSVMYAQPQTYNPKYSEGMGNIYAYLLKRI